MPTAEGVATFLAYEFLKGGCYSAAVGPVEVPSLAQAIATADSEEERPPTIEGFEGLQVQSVGCEEGAEIENPSVHLYLARGSKKMINALPDEIAGVSVRTHKMGPINVRPEASGTSTNHGHLFERSDRICCGSSCGPTSEQSAGTLGALVRTASSGPQLFLLSNKHVLAGCNHVPKGQPILSPASLDSRPVVRAPGEVGRHFQIQELRSGDPVFVSPCVADLAIARATNPSILSSWQGDANDGYDTPGTWAAPASLMPVKKFGRTTGLTRGEIEARVMTPMPVTYKAKHFKGTVWFTDVWTVRSQDGAAFALPGDSGSLVVREDGEHAVGILFAANPSGEYAWIIPMSAVAAEFGGLHLVNGLGV